MWYPGQAVNEDVIELILAALNNEKIKAELSKRIRIEMDNERQLFTIETLLELQKEYSDFELVFITGSDNLKELEKWQKADELVEKFKLLILERAEDKMEDIIATSDFLKNNVDRFIKAKLKLRSNLSSTFVRESIKLEKSIKYLTPVEIE